MFILKLKETKATWRMKDEKKYIEFKIKRIP